MTTTEINAACCCDFAQQYQKNTHPAFRALERSVLGCDYGGTSWTTREQAERIPDLLGLHDGMHMLELGSGAGWPSVFLAGLSQCRLTLLDLPVNALGLACDRARAEGLLYLPGAVSASAAQLPFASSSFDALGHSDVLCCLPEKSEMLYECRRVARPGARMLFYVIAPATNLGKTDMAEAIEAGPPFVDMADDYASMLRACGWHLLQCESIDKQYLQSLRRMTWGLEADAATFDGLMEPGEFPDMLKRRHRQVKAVERGLLVREMYLAVAV
jgi:cyclopropane fatty-acyl-phospholipid synthase-like methyltransferase